MSDLFNKHVDEIIAFNFNIVSKDLSRPWGGFLVIDETQAQEFSNKFLMD